MRRLSPVVKLTSSSAVPALPGYIFFVLVFKYCQWGYVVAPLYKSSMLYEVSSNFRSVVQIPTMGDNFIDFFKKDDPFADWKLYRNYEVSVFSTFERLQINSRAFTKDTLNKS